MDNLGDVQIFERLCEGGQATDHIRVGTSHAIVRGVEPNIWSTSRGNTTVENARVWSRY